MPLRRPGRPPARVLRQLGLRPHTLKAKPPRFRRWALASLAAAAGSLVLVRLSMSAVGWWLDSSDEPVRSDIIVTLAGRRTASLYAADLFARGYAPEIWISRPMRDGADPILQGLGIHYPAEEEINRQVLLKKGVPAERIRLYGNGLLSTADEASALLREFDPRGKKILAVTSRYHARRARMILRARLRGAEIRVVATPYEPFDRKWWRQKGLAEQALLEVCKTVFHVGGGRFLSGPPARL